MNAKVAETVLDTKEAGAENVETGLTTMDRKAFIPECVIAESLMTPPKDHFSAAPLDQQNPETLGSKPYTKSLQAAAVVEDTKLISLRPINTFTATRSSSVFIEEGDENVSLSTDPCQDQVSV